MLILRIGKMGHQNVNGVAYVNFTVGDILMINDGAAFP